MQGDGKGGHKASGKSPQNILESCHHVLSTVVTAALPVPTIHVSHPNLCRCPSLCLKCTSLPTDSGRAPAHLQVSASSLSSGKLDWPAVFSPHHVPLFTRLQHRC
ncbi:hypothetical protein VULLAG_LOCUS11080 [Vulpes lagopus]